MYKQLVILGDGRRVLISLSPEIYLYNGESISQLMFLGVDADPDEWKEISKEERDSIMSEESENNDSGFSFS